MKKDIKRPAKYRPAVLPIMPPLHHRQQQGGTPAYHATFTPSTAAREAGRRPAPQPEAPGGPFLLLYIHYNICEYSPNFETYQRKRPQAWQMPMEKRKAKKNERNRKKSPKNGSK